MGVIQSESVSLVVTVRAVLWPSPKLRQWGERKEEWRDGVSIETE